MHLNVCPPSRGPGFGFILVLFAIVFVPWPVLHAQAAGHAQRSLMGADYDVTIRSLVDEMVDLTRFLRPASPAYTTKLASSRDRGSEHGNWFANNDYSQFIRDIVVDGRLEHVLMEEYAPGAIVRVWSTNPKGTLRIYIDDSTHPAIVAPLADLLSGKVAPFGPAVAYYVCGGYNLYFPITFSHFCRVTADSSHELYYHVGYRLYQAGTRVEPYSVEKVMGMDSLLGRLESIYEKPGTMLDGIKALARISHTLVASAGQPARCTIPADIGGGMAREIVIHPAGKLPPLNGVHIAIRLDTVLATDVPIVPFFGAGGAPDAYTSLPFEIDSAGTMICRWPMGFRDSMTVELRSDSGMFAAEAVVALQPFRFDPDSMYYFHAEWRSEGGIPAMPRRDWNFVDIVGKGIYVGNSLTIGNPISFWWGEGDDKITLDSESVFDRWGTGVEDYYGSGLASFVPFSRPYHCYTETGPLGQHYFGWYGMWSMNRWHIPDPYPFEKSLRFDFEIIHLDRNSTISLGAMNYWYGLAGAYDAHAPQSSAVVTMPTYPTPDSIPGAIEGEWMDLLYFAGDYFVVEPAPARIGPGWSRAQYFQWRSAPGPAGNRIELGFKAPAAGRYHVIGYFVKGPGFGSYDLLLNGQLADHRVDVDADSIGGTGPVDLGTFDFNGVQDRLMIRVPEGDSSMVGKDFGVDALVLQSIPAAVAEPVESKEGLRWLGDGALGIEVAAGARVRLEMIDLLGNVVAVVADEVMEAGEHHLDPAMVPLPNGAYFYRMSIGGRIYLLRGVRAR